MQFHYYFYPVSYTHLRDVNIARNKTETNPERRKDTYQAEPGISREAQAEIKKILWNERMKAEAKRDAEKMKE